jgi:hypothetical protein
LFSGFTPTGSNSISVYNDTASPLDIYHVQVDEPAMGLAQFAMSIIDSTGNMFDSTEITEIPDSGFCSAGDLAGTSGCARFTYDIAAQSGEEFSIDIGNMSSIVAVPILPAYWLFGTGLVGLVGVARRQEVA